MFGVTIDLSVFRNPTVVQATAGDTNWHKFTGYPPDNTNITGFMITSVAAAGGSGSGFWVQWNVGAVAPSDNTKAWWVHGAGQVLVVGGGQNDLWYRQSAASDIIVLCYEG